MSSLQRFRLVFSYLALACVLTGFLSGSSCTVCSSNRYDDDDDDYRSSSSCSNDDDDDDDGLPSPGFDGESFRLSGFQVEASEDPLAHPYRRLTDIYGMSLNALWGLKLFGDEDLQIFTEHLLIANEDLIGAPTGLASLRFASVVLLDEGYVVTWLQDAGRPDAGREPAPGSIPEGPAVSFWFTRHGDLVTVENTTRLSLPAVLDRR